MLEKDNYNLMREKYPNLDWKADKIKDAFLFRKKDRYKQVIETKIGASKYGKSEHWYPGIKGTYSSLQFWLDRIPNEAGKLADVYMILDKIGNFSVEEQRAALRGYYTYWSFSRYV